MTRGSVDTKVNLASPAVTRPLAAVSRDSYWFVVNVHALNAVVGVSDYSDTDISDFFDNCANWPAFLSSFGLTFLQSRVPLQFRRGLLTVTDGVAWSVCHGRKPCKNG